MTEDARHQRCHVEDTQTEDTHPRSVEMRAKFKTEDIEIDENDRQARTMRHIIEKREKFKTKDIEVYRQKQEAIDEGLVQDLKKVARFRRDLKVDKSTRNYLRLLARSKITRWS